MSKLHPDCERVIVSEAQIESMLDRLAAEINRDYKGKTVYMVAIMRGAMVFYTDLIRKLDMDVRIEFMRATSYGNSTQTSGNVKILYDLEEDIAGKDVILVEDIVDTGITMSSTLALLKQRFPASLEICTLMDKPSRRKVPVDVKYAGMEIPDAFVVGYGLDYAEKYRNLPYIAVLKKEIYSD